MGQTVSQAVAPASARGLALQPLFTTSVHLISTRAARSRWVFRPYLL